MIELFITSKPILDDLLNHWKASEWERDEAYRIYAEGKETELENFVSAIAGLPQPHELQ